MFVIQWMHDINVIQYNTTMVSRLLQSLSIFPREIGIDLGTANTLCYVKGKGLSCMEPSFVARHKKTKTILAVGAEAKKMYGKTPDTIEVIRPLADGVISDFDAAEAMLLHYIEKLSENGIFSSLVKPTVVIGIPSGVTEVERRAVHAVTMHAGAGKVYLIEEAMAAAIGAGVHVEESEGRMIIDIGGGTSEIAIISLGGVVSHRSLRVAGDELDDAITTFVRSKHGLIIGGQTAEQIKISIGSCYPFEEKQQHVQTVARGRSVESGLPKSVKLTSTEVREALAPVMQQILSGILDTLEEAPPEVVADILKNGIILSGGTSQLRGFDKLVSDETKIQAWVTKDPQTSVVRGCVGVLENPKLLEKIKVTGGLQ